MAEEIAKAKKLLDDKVISDEEFNVLKTKALAPAAKLAETDGSKVLSAHLQSSDQSAKETLVDKFRKLALGADGSMMLAGSALKALKGEHKSPEVTLRVGKVTSITPLHEKISELLKKHDGQLPLSDDDTKFVTKHAVALVLEDIYVTTLANEIKIPSSRSFTLFPLTQR